MGDRGNGNKKLGMCIIIWQILIIVEMVTGNNNNNNLVFRVEHKYKGGKRSLKELLEHDARRHNARMLDSIDLPLGGNGQPSDAGLYYTKIKMGSPTKEFHVQVDTGSDVMWVNCASCENCPKKSRLGIELNKYDPKTSTSAKVINCDNKECSMIFQGPRTGCIPNSVCEYEVTYGDGSATAGYFVEDTFHYDKIVGNMLTSTADGPVVFGCASNQTGQLTSSDEAVDGIMGFGQSNSSVISQLAANGKVKKMFSHCLDNINGGGIFAIGQLVDPKVNSTPIIPDQPHYNVVLKSIEVGGEAVNMSTSSSGGSNDVFGAVIDSGTTLAYLPADFYKPIVDKILSSQPDLKMHVVEEQFHCFQYSGSVDEGFPKVLFKFDKDLVLTVHPHEYFFALGDDDNKWCIGWLNSGFQTKDGKQVTIFGDIILSNKLVVYDLENQNIGWTDYNCSSTIKVADTLSGVGHEVSSHEINSSTSLIFDTNLSLSFLIIIFNLLLFTIYH